MTRSHYLSAKPRSVNEGKSVHGVKAKDLANTPSRLFSTTVSTERRRQPKKKLQPIPPFRTGGGRHGGKTLGNRQMEPGLQGSFYESYVEKQKEYEAETREKCLFGPFVPTSFRPRWQTMAPMSYRRLPATVTVEVQAGPTMTPKYRAIRSAPAYPFATDLDDSTESNHIGGDLCGENRSHTATSDPGVHASPPRRTGGMTGVESREAAFSSGPNSPGQPARFNGDGTLERMRKNSKTSTLLKKGKEIPLFKESEQQQAKINDDSLGLSGALLPLFMRDNLEVKTVKSDSDALKVFKRFQDDNYVHVDDLPLCLAAVGFALHEDWIPGLLRDITSYSQLTLDNYLQFIEAFKSRQKESQRADFDRIDIDGSGTLDMDELAELLHSWGTWPMTHVLQELLDEADLDGNGKLDFEEFQNVVYLLRSRQGFCKSEYEEMISIFRMFDRNSQGLMAISDLRVALDWLGFVLTKEQVDIIISELDDDDRGQFDELEWLTCMRKVREQKVAELKRVIEDHDVQGHGSIQKMMLTPVLCSLGYFPDDQAVRETAAAAGISEDSLALDIGELWRFMKVYRDREGLTSKEVQEIEDGFLQCGVVLEGEVNMMQIGKIVRGIGYMLPFDTQQKLIAKVDITGNGKLTQREFRKMIRLVNQQDIDIIRLAFHESANLIETKAENVMGFTNAELLERLARDCTQFRPSIPGDREFITVSQATRALSRLGCIDAEGIVAPLHACDMIGPDCVDIFGFCNAARRARQASRVAFRKNGGFSQEDIHKMEDKFHEFDVDGNGELNGSEIIKVFEVHFPTLANDATRRPLILQLLKEADEDSSGTLDFGDFLRLMRQVTDIQDQLMIRKELQAIADTKFSPSEVLEFRELVLAVRGEEAEIGFDEVVRLLGAIVPMGAKNILQLRTMFDDAAKRQSGVEGSEEKLDFPEFLWLMRDVLDANFANMSERVAVVQEELVQERRKTRLSVMTEDEQQLDEKRRTWRQKTLDMRTKTGDLLTIPDI